MTFLVDGFNLYFSVRQAEAARKTPHLRWLDIHGLLESYLYTLGREAVLEEIHFFTALPFHRHRYDPGVVNRHEKHFEALRASGVHLHVAGFKRKDLTCPGCGTRIERHEEKETDVALGVKAIELSDGRLLRKPSQW